MGIFKTTSVAAWLSINGKPVVASIIENIWGPEIPASEVREMFYRHYGWETGETMFRRLSSEVTQFITTFA